MRRKEREVTDYQEIHKIIESSKIVRIGFNDNGNIYIVPVNFGFEYENEKLTLYFHGAKEGRKFSLIQKGETAGFEMDSNYQLQTAKTACEFSAYYSSIIGTGKVSEILENDEKKKALNLIMLNATGKGNWNFPTLMLSRVGVFKIEAAEFSCKSHKMPKI